MELKRSSLFIGSSKEGLEWARALQRAVEHDDCEPQVWTDGLFDQGGTALSSLVKATGNFDFAAFVLTPDDDVVRRGVASKAPRDNVIFELGLFASVLGPDRVFVFRPRQNVLATPSDWWGIFDGEFDLNAENKQAAMSTAATDLRSRVKTLGLRSSPKPAATNAAVDHGRELTDELNAIVKAAQSQGWSTQAWDGTVFRLVDPSKRKFSLPLTDDPVKDRLALRSDLVPKLVQEGLRVAMRVQAPLGADLMTWRPNKGTATTTPKVTELQPKADRAAAPKRK
jgi:hypothetical protein